MNDHTCYGCGRAIDDFEQHIHVGLDEWSAAKGLPGDFGMDDLVTFPLCSKCIKDGGSFTPEAHEIEPA